MPDFFDDLIELELLEDLEASRRYGNPAVRPYGPGFGTDPLLEVEEILLEEEIFEDLF